MKLLLDENLSRRLVDRIADLFPGSSHIAREGLLQSTDRAIWEFAAAKEFAVVSADSDFYELAITLGPPPKVIWLRNCDYPTIVAEGLIRGEAIRIREFLSDPDQAVLVLWAKKPPSHHI